MRPHLAIHDEGDRCGRHAIFTGKLYPVAAPILLPNRNHLLLCQAGARIILSATSDDGRPAPPFGAHVLHVVRVGAEEEVSRVAAPMAIDFDTIARKVRETDPTRTDAEIQASRLAP